MYNIFMYTYNQIFEKKQNILFVTAHPDDVIVYFCALIHKLRKDNKNVYVVAVTNGARGSRKNIIADTELAKQRIVEELAALSTLNVPKENFECLNYKDGEVESNLQLIGEISKCIRKWKIDIACTHEPSLQYLKTYDNSGYFVQHRDHRKVGEAVIDAVYPFSRDRSFFPEHNIEGIEPHSLYDILLTDEKESNFELDHTAEVEVKRKALLEHRSQMDEKTADEILNAFAQDGKNLEKFQYVNLLW